MDKKIIQNLVGILLGIATFILVFSIIYYAIKNNLSIFDIIKIGLYIPPFIKILLMILLIAALIAELYVLNKEKNIEDKEYLEAILIVMTLATISFLLLYIVVVVLEPHSLYFTLIENG